MNLPSQFWFSKFKLYKSSRVNSYDTILMEIALSARPRLLSPTNFIIHFKLKIYNYVLLKIYNYIISKIGILDIVSENNVMSAYSCHLKYTFRCPTFVFLFSSFQIIRMNNGEAFKPGQKFSDIKSSEIMHRIITIYNVTVIQVFHQKTLFFANNWPSFTF